MHIYTMCSTTYQKFCKLCLGDLPLACSRPWPSQAMKGSKLNITGTTSCVEFASKPSKSQRLRSSSFLPLFAARPRQPSRRAAVGARDDDLFGQTIQPALDHIEYTSAAHSCAKDTSQLGHEGAQWSRTAKSVHNFIHTL